MILDSCWRQHPQAHLLPPRGARQDVVKPARIMAFLHTAPDLMPYLQPKNDSQSQGQQDERSWCGSVASRPGIHRVVADGRPRAERCRYYVETTEERRSQRRASVEIRDLDAPGCHRDWQEARRWLLPPGGRMCPRHGGWRAQNERTVSGGGSAAGWQPIDQGGL